MATAATALSQLFEAARVLHRRKILLCGLNPEIIRIREPEAGDAEAAEEGERLMISTGGIWRAQDLLATLNERTLRGVALDDIELRYIAPELLTGATVDVRSDVFTIGTLAYEMATGRPPYDGSSMQELLGHMLAGAPPIRAARSRSFPSRGVPPSLERCRRRRPDRFATVAEFASRQQAEISATCTPTGMLRPSPVSALGFGGRLTSSTAQDRIHLHVRAQRGVEEVPVHQAVVGAWLEQVEGEAGERLIHAHDDGAFGQRALRPASTFR